LVTFKEEKNYAKVAQFLDWFCIDDKLLWINLEQFILKKERIFTDETFVKIL